MQKQNNLSPTSVVSELLPKMHDKLRQTIMSPKTENQQKLSGATLDGRHAERIDESTKECIKHDRREDKNKHVLNAISDDFGIMNRRLGMRQLKRGYAPQLYHRKSKKGEHVAHHDIANNCAEFFSQEQWGEKEGTCTQELPTETVIEEPVQTAQEAYQLTKSKTD